MGGAIVLAACGTDKVTSATGGGATSSTALPALNVVPRFDQNEYAVSGGEQRLVVSVLDSKGDTPKDLPASIDFTVLSGGKPVGAPITTTMHGDGIPVPYYPVRATFAQPGNYSLSATILGATSKTDFAVVAPSALPLIQPGAKLPAAVTPTPTDAQGVKPICTRVKNGGPDPCPLHTVTLADALKTAKPTVFLISTPAYCQIGICGPVLELLLEAQAKYPGISFLHAEVYKDPASGSHDPAPIVDTFGLNYEPALYLASADGTIVERLDNVFDRTEINLGLDKIKV